MKRNDGRADGAEREARGEELLAWILDPSARAATAREDVARDAEEARELAELEHFVRASREALDALERADDTRGLEEEILAATTREDLRVVGDLRLVGSFVRQSLAGSLLLRVVAASLLLHVVALPVVAYFALQAESEHGTLITLEPRDLPELPYSEEVAAEPEPLVEAPEPARDPASLPDAGELLARRNEARGLADPRRLAAPPYETVVWSDPLDLVLWSEHQLDRAEDGEAGSSRLLRFALANLSDHLSAEADEADAALRRLAASAWLRASEAGHTAELGPEFRLNPERLAEHERLVGDAWAEVYLRAAEGE